MNQETILVGIGASVGFSIACFCIRFFCRRQRIPENTPLPPHQPQPSAPLAREQPYIVYIPNQQTMPQQTISYPPQTISYPAQTISYPPHIMNYPPQTMPYPPQQV